MYICEDLWGTQDLKLKQWWLKDYFLLGYPPFPFFLFIWKGKESSLHPLRSLPDPFVKVCGLVTNSLLPAWMPLLMLGMGSGPARAWTLAADRPGRKSCFHHPPTYCHTIANPRQAFCSTCWIYRVTFPPTHHAPEKCHFVSRTRAAALIILFWTAKLKFEEEGDEEPPNTCSLHWSPFIVQRRGKNEAKKKAIKNMKKAAVYYDHYLIQQTF